MVVGFVDESESRIDGPILFDLLEGELTRIKNVFEMSVIDIIGFEFDGFVMTRNFAFDLLAFVPNERVMAVTGNARRTVGTGIAMRDEITANVALTVIGSEKE